MLVWDIFYYPFPFVVGRNGDVNLLTVATFRTIKQCQGALCDDAGLDTNIAQYAFSYNIVCVVECRNGDFQFVVASVVWECEYFISLLGRIDISIFRLPTVYASGLCRCVKA